MICEKTRKNMIPIALTLLRVGVGVIMAVHGWQKFQNPAQIIEGVTKMGFPIPVVMGWLAIAGELLGGLGLIVGLLTPIAAFGVFVTMAVAVFKVHFANGLLASNNGFEYPMTLMLASLFFIFNGAGPISLDHLLCRKKCGENHCTS